jgi:hypothetical protein
MRPCWALAAICGAFAIGGCGAPAGGSAVTADRTTAFDGGPVSEGDAGPIVAADAGPADAGVILAAEVVWKETGFDLLAVDRAGTAYAVSTNGSDSDLWASADGQSWARRGSPPSGASFRVMSALEDGTLLANVVDQSGNAIARSADHGATWKKVLSTGVYRALTPHSFGELAGVVYFLEYQVFTIASTPIRLWASTDGGASWTVRYTFQGHRHGHGLASDTVRNSLWAFFGDSDAQSGAYRSTDGGATWKAVVAGDQDGDIVDALVLPDGSLLCGQDISYQPPHPAVARIHLDGSVDHLFTLPSASYSTHAIAGGGYVVGSTYELDNDVSPAGWTSGSLWGSGDGLSWEKLLEVAQLDAHDDVRTDVYWELSSGELVVNVRNGIGFGPGGLGYLLLRTTRR